MAYTVPSAPGNADRLTQLASLKFAQTTRCVAINMNKRPVVVGFILWRNRVTAGQQQVFLSIHRRKLTNLRRRVKRKYSLPPMVKHFLTDMREHAHRLKRGEGKVLETIEPGTDTSPGLQLPDPNAP